MFKISNIRFLKVLSILLIISCGKKEKEVVLIERDGVSYEQGAQKPYSGPGLSKYSNGKSKTKGQYVDGAPSGVWKFWDRDGIEYTGSASRYVFHQIESGETIQKIADKFEVDINQLYQLNEDLDKNSNDKIKSEQLINIKEVDKSDGQSLVWYDKSRTKIKSHKTFKNSKRTGKWTFWNENSNVARTMSYNDGKKDGDYAFYFQDGSKKEEGSWKNDKRDALWVQNLKNGNKKKEGTYLNGKKDGVWTTWNEEELISSKYLYENNIVIDKWAFKYAFYSNGNEKSLKSTRNNKLDGDQSLWYKNGQMKSNENYTKGLEDGDFEEWYENGQLIFKKTFVQGALSGVSSKWYENGNKETLTNYENGIKNGVFLDWFENGQMRQEGNFVDGEFFLSTRWNKDSGILIKDGNGKWEAKDSKGKKLWAKEYKDGRLVSDWEYKYEYFDNGNIKKEISFQGGEEDESKTFFENGKVKEEGKWVEGEYLISNRWSSKGGLIIKDGQGRIKGSNKDGLVLYEKEYIDGRLAFDQENKHEFYSNGQLKSEIGYFEGKKHGSYSLMFEDGNFNERGKYQNGEPYGFYELWIEGGQKREEGRWTTEGEYIIKNRWNKQGGILINDGNGSLIGKNKEGLVVWKKEYIDGRLEFDQQNKHEFHSNGQLKSEIGYYENKKHGLYKTWYENGQQKTQGKYQFGKDYDRYAQWFDNGNLKEQGEYKNDVYFMINRRSKGGSQLVTDGNGSWVGRDVNGLELWKKLYSDGLLEKEWDFEYEYHPNNELMSSKRFLRGMKDGPFITWYDNGQKRSESFWEFDKRIGKWLTWYSNGQLESQGSYVDDKKDGRWVSYNKTGEKVTELVYAAGELVNN